MDSFYRTRVDGFIMSRCIERLQGVEFVPLGDAEEFLKSRDGRDRGACHVRDINQNARIQKLTLHRIHPPLPLRGTFAPPDGDPFSCPVATPSDTRCGTETGACHMKWKNLCGLHLQPIDFGLKAMVGFCKQHVQLQLRKITVRAHAVCLASFTQVVSGPTAVDSIRKKSNVQRCNSVTQLCHH